jgi:hypothetical protein
MWSFLSLVLLCVTLITLFGIYAVFRPTFPSLSRSRVGNDELADLRRQIAAMYEELRAVREMLADMALEAHHLKSLSAADDLKRREGS